MWGIVAIFVLIIILTIILIYFITRKNIYEKISDLDGNPNQQDVKEVIEDLETHTRTPLEELHLADLYAIYVLEDAQAQQHYRAALEMTIMHVDEHTPFILDQIEDFAFMADAPGMQFMRMPVVQNLRNLYYTAPATNKKWHSDPQNVHDSAIILESQSQFADIAERNSREEALEHHTFEDMCTYLHNYSNNSEVTAKVLEQMGHNIPIPSLSRRNTSVCERDFCAEIWKRVHSKDNAERRRDLIKSFMSAVEDCYENNSVVCPDGRASRLLASLAMLDKADFGVLKNKETIRNELFETVGNIVRQTVESASKEEQEEYNKNDESSLKGKIQEKVRESVEQYRDKLPADFFQRTLAECLAST